MYKKQKILICSILIAVLIFVTTGCKKTSYDYALDIIDYCKHAETFTFLEVTDFEWDIAYVDYDAYESGEHIKESYDLDVDLTTLMTEELYRIVFCKDDEFVKELIFSLWEVRIDYDVDVFKPDTIFNVSWETYSDDAVLILKPEE